MKKTLLTLVALALLTSGPASAVITFTQLDEEVFVVSHRVKLIGSRARALGLVYEKAASLCLATGYSHFEILDQESSAHQEYQDANATITARFSTEDGEGRMECAPKANPKYVKQAEKKLARRY